ncbi:hypothetical protein BJV85_000895 [Clostridium acetobutylicum]|uniref:Uncharacterized consrved protein, containing Zn finger n=1 Tax=Clostridium acetobutylicum (strain ATCC 824 / DSM 792 / JCM 1419 / IAM 19013 / LMG 5710 / NBRC 13948 / NRRL B-527 / VKM B-1787 / 2291 / W) TaxID=272562 RepID=Q97EV5_CLOAB|nr:MULTISPECIES: DUF2089 family protein [Clostridium]AAK80942.1 Uncharacterized consrved protein, containing Zn finger [Clostridium acetobutylicum ATCC 824]ADZ22044.1 Conserved hypothetical protein [Clostridium acetobutylicum EA 2018]AEI32642.1 hypothetical protein SMB_G3037 [Clostridium acetobutylicum DSM 1731]AWV78647.1 DUF2089 family protein [Clostridium acetobutylicum]MBC2393508.1 DUF2089 family protein [Clostridium acetobutylicum]
MSYKVINRCPVCGRKLIITRLKCSNCETTIENNFKMSKFEYLTSDQLMFVEVFLKCRGSIKEVEKELNISYPTVRTKLDEVIRALGYNTDSENSVNIGKKKIIDMLEKGEISPDDAIKMLNKEGNTNNGGE